MYNRNIKGFERFIFSQKLMEDVALNDINPKKVKKEYNKLYFNQQLLADVEDNIFEEANADYIPNITEWDKDPESFYNSVYANKRVGFLSTYSIDDLKKFDLYKVPGYNIGFAIKSDGDIILVHNNEKIKGVGRILIERAIQFGGNKLDHFDGFLTGYYKSFNFHVVEHDKFLEEFAPTAWKYEPININDPLYSIYPEEIRVSAPEFHEAKNRYDYGMPDVVYRSLKN